MNLRIAVNWLKILFPCKSNGVGNDYKTVHMMNGKSFKISQGNADHLLRDSITHFKAFCNDDKLYLFINVHDISYID